MNLYLVRHGLAHWPAWEGQDTERPLNPEGVRLTRAEGAALARLGIKPDLILHSPLVRARQTAELIAEALELEDRLREQDSLSPGFDLKALKKILDEHAARDELMLVGHGPDMPELVSKLTGGAVRFKEGALAYMSIEKQANAPEGVLIWLATAELLTKM